MKLQETISTNPVHYKPSVRPYNFRNLTSGKAGKILPVGYIPLLREDRLSTSRVRVQLEMMETAEMLLNAVNVTCYAHFVPLLWSEADKCLGASAIKQIFVRD